MMKLYQGSPAEADQLGENGLQSGKGGQRWSGTSGQDYRKHADIVITDIQMPGVDGLQVCKYIYETSPETQVIILTAYSDFEYAKEAIKYSACGYVTENFHY